MNLPSRHIINPPNQALMVLLMACYLLFAAGGAWAESKADSSPNTPVKIVNLSVNGIIGPATDDYIQRAIEKATELNAELIILQIDTPGGLSRSMRGIVKNIANSVIPVASYVSPTGARAASAGTYILYASHIAAMSPGTNIGAATPIQLGGGSPLSSPLSDQDPNKEDPAKIKAVNDAVAYIQGLAQLHDRNAEWAEKAVREGVSIPSEEALKLNVIDLIASNTQDLLKQIDGRSVIVLQNRQTLNTSAASLISITPDWRSRLLSVITNPNIAYILMLIGIYGLILEFYNPGAILPGTIGAISLLLALYAFQLLPINYAGMALIVLGISLMVAEAFEPSFGMLGIGGTIAFIIGSVILIDTDLPGFGIELSIIITFAVISVVVFIILIGLALKSQARPVVSGIEGLIGEQATVLEDFEQQGTVSVHSEHWQASSAAPLKKGERVKIIAVRNLLLLVEPITEIQKEKQP